jgi:hypothetical protein
MGLRRLMRRWLGLEAVEYRVSVVEPLLDRRDQLAGSLQAHTERLLEFSERISALERELDVEDASSITEATANTARRRRLWLEELSGQLLSEEEKRAWEAGL